MKSFKNYEKILIVLIPILSVLFLLIVFSRSSIYNKDSSNTNAYLNQEYINSVVDSIKEKYINENVDLNREKLTYAAVKGIVDSLEDPYTIFFDPEETKAYTEGLNSTFEGIGITLLYNDNYTFVESVFKDYPAFKNGVMTGDQILKINGQDMYKKVPAEVAKLIRGEKGTEVEIEILRAKDISTEKKTFKITREKIEVNNISWKENNGIITINISRFTDITVGEFIDSWDKVVEEVQNKFPNRKGLILDLRGNPGGYVEGVRYIMEDFYPNKTILFKERKKGEEDKVYEDKRKGRFETDKLVVLVNEGSASASEIFSGAVQDNNRGKVVGKKTVGKGVEQTVIEFNNDTMLFLVFQKWLTPNSREITSENPIIPDVEIDYVYEEIIRGVDKQHEKAIEIILN